MIRAGRLSITMTTSPSLCKSDITKSGATLRQVMDHPTIGREFRDYAASRHAAEGLSFLDDYAESASELDFSVAEKLMAKYFLDTAPMSVNLADKVRASLFEAYKSKRMFSTIGKLFEEAMFEVFADLKKSDTFRQFCEQNEQAKVLFDDGDVVLLDRWVVPENFRKVVPTVLGDANLVNLVRFCCSVTEFERLAPRSKERKLQGNKIKSTFVQLGSRFEVALPKLYTDAILGEERADDVLMDARVECLQILSMERELINLCRTENLRG